MKGKKQTMRCNVAKKLLPLHAGGDCPDALADGLEGHLRGCASCAAELETFRAHRRRLKRLVRRDEPPGVDLGERFWLEVKARAFPEGVPAPAAVPAGVPSRGGERKIIPLPERTFSRGLVWRAAAAAAAIVLAVLVTGLPSNEAPPDEAVIRPRPAPTGTAPDAATVVPVRSAVADPGAFHLEEAETFGPPGVQYHLEGWRPAPSADGGEAF